MLEHTLDVCNWRFRQDAVAKIEDQWTTTEYFHNIVDLTIERGAACEKSEWIDVALHRHTRLQHVTRNRSLKSPINSNRAYAGHFNVGQDHCTCSARKPDNFCSWYLTTHALHDFLRRRNAPPIKLIMPQDPNPGVATLDNL